MTRCEATHGYVDGFPVVGGAPADRTFFAEIKGRKVWIYEKIDDEEPRIKIGKYVTLFCSDGVVLHGEA